MKKLLSLLFAACLGGTALADNIQLYLIATSGTKTAYDVSDIDKITFADGQVLVTTTSGTTTATSIASLSSMYFNSETAEGVEMLQADAIDLSRATVYDLAGRRLSALQTGVNIVRTADGQTLKVYKKK